jgi:4-amino-4-deoxy-L-arabinose transferase-like glycosyltransferase
MLARPMMQFYPLIVLVLFWWALDRRWLQILSMCAVFCLAFAAVLSPWVIRNYRLFNAFIPGSVYSGKPFYEGNYALGEADYLRHRGAEEASIALREVLVTRFGAAPDGPDLSSYVRAKGIDDVELNRVASQEAVKLITAHPEDYLVLSTVRFMRLWFHHRFVTFMLMGGKIPNAWSVAAINAVLLGLAVAAFIWFRGSWVRSAVPLVALVLYNTAVYSATHAIGRYNVPIMPYVIVLAAFTMVRLCSKSNRQPRVRLG